ncbi:MAG: HEAT repeat domain-containing protein [Oleiphilaceae bacterium]|nr:HEAT repeat domain-containing protein [Oleiphilaceae bacterium]
MKAALLALALLLWPVHGLAHGGHGMAPVITAAPEGKGLLPSPGERHSHWTRELMRPQLPQANDHDGVLLRQSLADAPLLVQAITGQVESLDNGRLVRLTLELESVYRGDFAEPRVAVVEFSGARQSTLSLSANQRVLLALEPMPEHSYLRDRLGAGRFYTPVRQQPAPLVVTSPEGASALGQWLLLGRSEPSHRSRALALGMLSSGESILTGPALDELALVPSGEALTAEEKSAIRTVMEQSLPGRGRLAIQLARWPQSETLEPLAVLSGDDPVTRARIRLARHSLGQGPDLDRLMAESRSEDPRERAGAGRVLGLLDDDRARRAAAGLALADKNPEVRAVALHGLTLSRDPKVLPVIGQALDTPHQPQRFQAGRALEAFAGQARSNLLERLVLAGENRESREYAAKLMVYHLGRDHSQVVALRSRLEAGELRRILTDGAVDRGRVHAHDGHDH